MFVALNPSQLPARRGAQTEQGVLLWRAEEVETLSCRTVVEFNAESRLAPQRRIASIVRRPERSLRLASERTGRADRRQPERAARIDHSQRPPRRPEPEERGMVADAR